MALVNPADVRSQQTVVQKARWRKGFPASHTFGESRYTVAREGNDWYAYCNRLGVFFVSTTPQLVFDAIQNDMNQNNITGALIHVKTGTITGVSVTLDRDNTILEGEGWQTFLDATSGNPAVTITGDGCVIRDLGVRTIAGSGADAIHVNGSSSLIENVWVWGSDDDGIRVDDIGCIITKCLLAEIGGYGIRVYDGDYAKIINNNIQGVGDDGIRVDGYYSHISNNDIMQCTGNGIYLNSSSNVVDNNTIYIVGGNFVLVGSTQNIVRGNYCFNSTGIGIHIAHQNNIVANNLLNRTYDSAIVIASGRNHNIVKGNSIMAMWGVNGYGILVSPCSGAIIGDNNIQSVASGYGIRLLPKTSGVVVNCNRINRSATSGLWMSGHNHVVTGNFTYRIIDNSFGSMVRGNKNMSGA